MSRFITYEVFYWLDVEKSERGFIEVRNDVKMRCWHALREAGVTFSTDVTSGLEIKSAPEVQVMLASAGMG